VRVLGFAVIMLGVIIAYIGITGSQHRVMNIIKTAAGGGAAESKGNKGSLPSPSPLNPGAITL
jgi:hypothetical protein